MLTKLILINNKKNHKIKIIIRESMAAIVVEALMIDREIIQYLEKVHTMTCRQREKRPFMMM